MPRFGEEGEKLIEPLKRFGTLAAVIPNSIEKKMERHLPACGAVVPVASPRYLNEHRESADRGVEVQETFHLQCYPFEGASRRGA